MLYVVSFDVLHFLMYISGTSCIALSSTKGQLSVLCSCVNTGLAAWPKPLYHPLSIWLVHKDGPWSWIKSATRHSDRSLSRFTLQMERRQTWNGSQQSFCTSPILYSLTTIDSMYYSNLPPSAFSALSSTPTLNRKENNQECSLSDSPLENLATSTPVKLSSD